VLVVGGEWAHSVRRKGCGSDGSPEPAVGLLGGLAVGLKTRELAGAEGLAIEHQQLIIEKWHEYFD